MIFKGFKFGMLLQFAIGPMCLFVFNTSAKYGFTYALTVVLAIAIIDALYIALSCVGVAAIINNERIKITIKLIGCIVLILFGLNTISSAFDYSFLADINLFSSVSSKSLFIQGLLLTASNPLIIIFWSGVLSTQISDNNWNNKQLFLFTAGCVLSTIIFLTIIATLGSVLTSFLPQIIVKCLNIIVGIVLIIFGLRLLFKRKLS